MKKNSIVKVISVILALVFLLGISGCGSSKPAEKSAPESKSVQESKQPEQKQVTIKLFSNLPDRSAGQGKLEQLLLDKYMQENKNVKIEVEALQDEPYKQKFKAYAAGNQLPDMYMVWGLPAFMKPVMEAGYAAELNEADFNDYGFFPGSFNGFKLNGKLYGLPRNTDFYVLYYNKKLFADNGVKVPESFEDLIEAAKVFRSKGIAPLATAGKDKWPISSLIQEVLMKRQGNLTPLFDMLGGKVKATESQALIQAAKDMKTLMDVKFYQDSFASADYGTAQNLFAQGKAAMFYMGSWDVSMAANTAFSEEFRQNVTAIPFPAPKDGKGKASDIRASHNGGYAVSSKSPNKEEALKLLKWMMKPENWAKNAWETGTVVPGQKYDKYFTGKETSLQKRLTEILNANTLQEAGKPSWQDALTPEFKTVCQDLSQELCTGIKTPEQFVKAIDEAVTKALGK